MLWDLVRLRSCFSLRDVASRGGRSLLSAGGRRKTGFGGVVGRRDCSQTSPLAFLGCIKCAACQGKIVELVGDSPLTDLSVREGGRLPSSGWWHGRLLAASQWPSLLEKVGTGGCPGVHIGLWAARGGLWVITGAMAEEPASSPEMFLGSLPAAPSLLPPAHSGPGGEGSPPDPFPSVGVLILLLPDGAAVLRQPQERLNLDLNYVFMSPM